MSNTEAPITMRRRNVEKFGYLPAADFYAVLGLSETATRGDVRAAARRLSLSIEVGSLGSAARLAAIQHIEGVLCDVGRRTRYDVARLARRIDRHRRLLSQAFHGDLYVVLAHESLGQHRLASKLRRRIAPARRWFATLGPSRSVSRESPWDEPRMDAAAIHAALELIAHSVLDETSRASAPTRRRRRSSSTAPSTQ